jgi:hypothetical protein
VTKLKSARHWRLDYCGIIIYCSDYNGQFIYTRCRKIALGVLLAIVCSCTLQDAAACIPSPNISVIPSLCTCRGCHSTVNFTVNLTDSTICLSGDFNIDIFHHGQTLLLHPRPDKNFDQILHICYVSLLIENGTSFFGRSDLVLTEEYDNSTLQVILRTNPHLCSNNFTLRVQGTCNHYSTWWTSCDCYCTLQVYLIL